jgi:hypothetical protein
MGLFFNMNTYQTEDSYLGAFLEASGIPLCAFERWNGETRFKLAEKDNPDENICGDVHVRLLCHFTPSYTPRLFFWTHPAPNLSAVSNPGPFSVGMSVEHVFTRMSSVSQLQERSEWR